MGLEDKACHILPVVKKLDSAIRCMITRGENSRVYVEGLDPPDLRQLSISNELYKFIISLFPIPAHVLRNNLIKDGIPSLL